MYIKLPYVSKWYKDDCFCPIYTFLSYKLYIILSLSIPFRLSNTHWMHHLNNLFTDIHRFLSLLETYDNKNCTIWKPSPREK